jgi:2-methylisocitrate lyase-like PEP mutase family enzyme
MTSKAYGSAVSNALMIAQTRKTNAEATIVEDHQNQAKLESELYGSGVGMIPVASAISRVCAVLDISVCQAR